MFLITIVYLLRIFLCVIRIFDISECHDIIIYNFQNSLSILKLPAAWSNQKKILSYNTKVAENNHIVLSGIFSDYFDSLNNGCWKAFSTPIMTWGRWQCLAFSCSTLRDKHCQRPIAVIGIAHAFEHCLKLAIFHLKFL